MIIMIVMASSFWFLPFPSSASQPATITNTLLQDPRFNPSLDNPPGYRWSFTEQEKKSSKKMSHLHSRKYIFIKETCHFHLRKDKIFIQGEKRPKSYINLDFRVNSTACLPIRNSKVNIIRFWIWGVRIPRSILFLLSLDSIGIHITT